MNPNQLSQIHKMHHTEMRHFTHLKHVVIIGLWDGEETG